jgi:hypothetical protein
VSANTLAVIAIFAVELARPSAGEFLELGPICFLVIHAGRVFGGLRSRNAMPGLQEAHKVQDLPQLEFGQGADLLKNLLDHIHKWIPRFFSTTLALYHQAPRKTIPAVGEDEEILYVKGSGWDLETIETAGFSPVRLEHLKTLAKLPSLPDPQMANENW